MLGLYAVLCYCSTRLSARPTRSVIKKYGLAESLQRMSQGSGQPEKEHTCEPPLLIWPASFPARAPQSERILVYLNVFWSTWKYARGLLVYLNVFWSTGTCYRLCVCCACISATAPRLADSGRTRRSRQRPRPRQRLHGTTTTTKGLIVYTKQTSRVGFNTYTYR